MRIIKGTKITETIAKLCIDANIYADSDIRRCICAAHKSETLPLAQNALGMIIENMEIAETEKMPMCQDTGLVVVFIEIGQDVHVQGSITDAVNEGVRRGYRDGYFRASIVADPIRRVNTGDNTPAVIHFNIVDGDKIKIMVMPKGFGSENKGAVRMLTPSEGLAGIESFMLETVKKAGADPCPPILVGVGVGGTMEKAALLSKQALAQMYDKEKDPYWAEVEDRLLQKINELNIGVAGLGGKTTALGVRILTYPTHIAGLPVAVTIGCHVSRHKSAVL
ncbi:MAG: fumarate hydratase [Defluviitaleaceae bacterium]|nr:fumarate hydratase [Defluviitaleaceae bacterium]